MKRTTRAKKDNGQQQQRQMKKGSNGQRQATKRSSNVQRETKVDSPEAACLSPEGPQLPSSSREMRNRAEKMRRDKINSHIQQMNGLLSPLSNSTKRLDKTTTLRLAVTYLRIAQLSLQHKVEADPLYQFVDDDRLEEFMLHMNGFFLLLSGNGKIIYISKTVEKLLGHTPIDLLGQSIYAYTAPSDQGRLRSHLNTEQATFLDWRKYFEIRLKRAGPRTEAPIFELVNFKGLIKSNRTSSPMTSSACTSPGVSSTTQPYMPGPSTSNLYYNNNNSDDVFVFFVKLTRPEPIRDQLLVAVKDEYVTRHLVDGRIVNCDQRVAYVAGYLTEEICGVSAFGYMHRDDVRWVMIALRQMYDRGERRGQSCYRLLSKTNQFIYLRTCGFLEIDETGAVETFVCINTLVSEQEGQQLIRQMKKRYSALIQAENFVDEEKESSEETVEDPKKLEIAISHLITNLPSPEPRSSSSPHSALEIKDCRPTNERNSHHQPLAIRVKTVTKRPPNAETEAHNAKRRKPSSEFLHVHSTSSYQTSSANGNVAHGEKQMFDNSEHYVKSSF